MFGFLQRIGRSLLLPIAILPLAAVLLRLGAPDLLNIPFMAAAGAAVFDNLALLFAAGIAVGMAADHRGEAVLAAITGYYVLVATTQALLSSPLPVGGGYSALDPVVTQLDNNVLFGVLVGLVAAWTYNAFRYVELPDLLGYFSGRRLIPILTFIFVLLLALGLRFIWPPIWNGLNSFNNTMLDLGVLGTGIYGFLNRALIPFGLQQVPNTFFWFEVGEFTAANGAVVTGDIPRFLSGDPTAGSYQVGLYPIMMLGLLGAALAMILLAKDGRRKATAGLLGIAALVSFGTGITEPLEFSFLFAAPFLYLIHALFTALSFYLSNFMGLRDGFGFSAGLPDYLLYFDLAEGPLELAAVGGGFFILYLVVFYGLIRAFDLKTPGREDLEVLAEDDLAGTFEDLSAEDEALVARARGIIYALGGRDNIIAVDSCTTRLRLTVENASRVNEQSLKALGAKGVVKPSSKAVQVMMDGDAVAVAYAMQEVLEGPAPTASSDKQWRLPDETVGPPPVVAPVVAGAAIVAAGTIDENAEAAAEEKEPEAAAPPPKTVVYRPAVADDPAVAASVNLLLSALGGPKNIRDAGVAAMTRLRVVVYDPARVEEESLRAAGASGVMIMDDTIHILLGQRAPQFAAEMEARLLEART